VNGWEPWHYVVILISSHLVAMSIGALICSAYVRFRR